MCSNKFPPLKVSIRLAIDEVWYRSQNKLLEVTSVTIQGKQSYIILYRRMPIAEYLGSLL